MLSWAMIACGGGSGDSGSSLEPIPDGVYTLIGPTCGSSVATNYSSASGAAFFRDFVNTTERTITLAKTSLIETSKDADCTLETTQVVDRNSGGKLTLTNEIAFSFSPQGCAMTVLVGGVEKEVDASLEENDIKAFAQKTDTSASFPLNVSKVDDDYVVALPLLVAGYGCDSKPHQWRWQPQ